MVPYAYTKIGPIELISSLVAWLLTILPWKWYEMKRVTISLFVSVHVLWNNQKWRMSVNIIDCHRMIKCIKHNRMQRRIAHIWLQCSWEWYNIHSQFNWSHFINRIHQFHFVFVFPFLLLFLLLRCRFDWWNYNFISDNWSTILVLSLSLLFGSIPQTIHPMRCA